jgi:Peptidase family S41
MPLFTSLNPDRGAPRTCDNSNRKSHMRSYVARLMTLSLLAGWTAARSPAQSAMHVMARTGGLLPIGTWLSPGYGYIAAVGASDVQRYDLTRIGCVRAERVSRTYFRDVYGSATSVSTPDSMILERVPTRDPVVRLASLPTACRRPLKTTDVMANFDIFTETFSAHYPFFRERRVDWSRAVAAARTRLERARQRDSLFAVLRDLVRPLDDGHVSIVAGKDAFDPQSVLAPGVAPDGRPWSWRALRVSLRDHLQGAQTPLLEPARFAGNNRVMYGRLADDIGYLAVLAEGGWADGQTEDTPAMLHAATAALVLDSVFNSLGDVRGMVVDLRVNSGGFDAVALELASHFTDTTRLAYRKSVRPQGRETVPYDVLVVPASGRRWLVPVAVLTGPNTVSAGETAVLAFASFPHARLFGQPTRGMLSDAIPRTLPNGWEFTLSMEVARTPGGDVVELAGVQPAQLTPAPVNGAPAGLWDADLRAAQVWLRATVRR